MAKNNEGAWVRVLSPESGKAFIPLREIIEDNQTTVNRRVYKIDVGNLKASEIEAYMKGIVDDINLTKSDSEK